jgi:hypothetical protein
MSASSYDSTTGHPIFLDGDAPDVAVNATQVAEYASRVGTRLIGSAAERAAYPYVRDGLRWFDTDDDTEYQHDGSGWYPVSHGWKAYTPSMTNVSGGSITGQYRLENGLVVVRIRHVLASAGVTGQPTYSLPVNANSTSLNHLIGSVLLVDSSAGNEYGGVVRKAASVVNAVAPYVWGVGGTYLLFANVSASAPFTWASGDVIDMQFQYRS